MEKNSVVNQVINTRKPLIMHSPCCSVSRATRDVVRPSEAALNGPVGTSDGMVYREGGTFLMGTDQPTFPADGEGPVREVALSPFWIEPYAVTNEQFSAFVEATGYRTEAERFEWSYVFYQFLPAGFPPTKGVAAAPWWRQVFGAHWRHPEGPQSSIDERLNHPVVHVSWNDAVAYANWAGKRCPPKPNGNMRRGVGSCRMPTPGATAWCLTKGTAATSGKVPFRRTTRSRMVTRVQHRWTLSNPTVTGCTT